MCHTSLKWGHSYHNRQIPLTNLISYVRGQLLSNIRNLLVSFPQSGWTKWGKRNLRKQIFRTTAVSVIHAAFWKPLSQHASSNSHYTLQKTSPPPCRIPTDKCHVSFTSCPPSLCIHTTLHREQDKQPLHVWKDHTSTHGLAWSSWDFSGPEGHWIPFVWYLFLELPLQMYSRRWPYCKSSSPTALLKLLRLDLCSSC